MFKQCASVLSALIVVAGLLAGPRPANAIMLMFDPVDQTVEVGQQATVNVVFDPLPEMALIGGFDISVIWDADVLGLNEVIVDPTGALAEPGLDPIAIFNAAPGFANVFAVALSPTLPAQNGTEPVTLFSMVFDTLLAEVSELSFVDVLLSDAVGVLLEGPITDGSIAVMEPDDPGPTPVPEPATWLLLASGMLGFLTLRRTLGA